MTIWDYPITTPYGQVPNYPLNNGFHNGIDYGCPVGTPVVVNGVTIGLSGNTGYSSGPHCHVGKWSGGVVQNPLNGGRTFDNAKVTEINEDATNGKYVRVQGDGYSWVYLHLSNNNLVTVGQVLNKQEEVSDMPNAGDVDNAYLQANGRVATDEEKRVYTSKPWSAGDGLYYGKVRKDFENLQNALKEAQNASYEPVGELFIKKKG